MPPAARYVCAGRTRRAGTCRSRDRRGIAETDMAEGLSTKGKRAARVISSEVYRAKDTRLDRTVAIKILPPQFAADPEARARFEREGRAISSLDHPHICALYDVGEHDGTTFLVMQYLEGETLEARLKKGAAAARTGHCRSPSRSPTRSTRRTAPASSIAI